MRSLSRSKQAFPAITTVSTPVLIVWVGGLSSVGTLSRLHTKVLEKATHAWLASHLDIYLCGFNVYFSPSSPLSPSLPSLSRQLQSRILSTLLLLLHTTSFRCHLCPPPSLHPPSTTSSLRFSPLRINTHLSKQQSRFDSFRICCSSPSNHSHGNQLGCYKS